MKRPRYNQVPLDDWPTATGPAEYLGAQVDEGAVVMAWQAEPGVVALVWQLPIRGPQIDVESYARRIKGADAVVAVLIDFGFTGPGAQAVPGARPDRNYETEYSELARVLGAPVPYWPYMLRIPELICAWRPGAPSVIHPANCEIDTGVLLRLAASYADENPAFRVLLNTARLVQWSGTSYSLSDVADAHKHIGPDVLTIAAHPLPTPEVTREDIDPLTRRGGWLDVLSRSDTLSVSCVREVRKWDLGRDFPFSGGEIIDPHAPLGAEWASRLTPTARTAATEIVDPDGDLAAFIDPETDAPAVQKGNGTFITAVPERLPTTSPLAQVILDHPIWVRTDDGTLYPAPQHHHFGISWGYGGSGPATLALTLGRLLEDITAPAGDSAGDDPEGLHQLTMTKWPRGTTLTRS